ncbi:MAG: hypothetical protein ACR2KE_04300 [Candidatus Nanopelagicales bacterium]
MPSAHRLRSWLAGALAILVAALIAAACALWWVRSTVGGTSIRGTPYSLGTCRPESADAGFTRDPLLVGADVGASARLGDGRVIWAYGDTFRRPDGVTLTAVRNSLVIEDGDCRAVVIPAGGQEAIPDRVDGVGYWPMSIAVTRERGASVVRVFAERVSGSESRLGFANLGPAMATLRIPDGGDPVFQSVADLGPDDLSRANVGWGAAVADGGDGYWYVYGTASPEAPLVFGWSVRVARARVQDLDIPAAWEYWSGSAWTSNPADAAEVIPAEGGVSQTFSVFVRDGTWFALSKRDGDLGTDLAVWSAAHPWGAFSDPVTVGRIPNEDSPSLLRYMPLAHPEASVDSSVLVSVCRNSLDPRRLVETPSLYRPFFVEIPLPPTSSHAPLDPHG